MKGSARRLWGSICVLSLMAVVAGLPSEATAALRSRGGPCAWSIAHHVPTVDTGANDLRAVAALSSSDAWAIGYSTDQIGFTHSLALHWDGSSWDIVDTPSPYEFSRFFAIAALAPDDVWAAGDFFSPAKEGALIEHWDGHAWKIFGAKSDGQILGLAGIGANDVWAVGEGGKVGADRPIARHWDGMGWQKVKVPFALSNGWLDAVGAVSPGDVWAGGQPNLTYHWDGSRWREVQGPGGDGITFFNAVGAIAPTDVWPIGNDDVYAFSRHWDGSAWAVSDMPRLANTELGGAVGLGPTDVWAVGSYGRRQPYTALTLAMHWDGATWSTVETPNPESPRTRAILRGVAADTAGLWAVGQHLSRGQWRTLIERCA
jgi:hypothetical protein